jgi:non-ribosomal peptide synthetase component F
MSAWRKRLQDIRRPATKRSFSTSRPTQEELSHIAFVFRHSLKTGRGMIQRLQDWVAAQAQQRPEATALVLGNERMTYGRLEEISNQLARMLRKGGCGRGDRVCLLLPKSPRAIASILGVLKAGCIYVPLDPSCPAARLAKMVATSENRWMLVGGPAGPIVDELADKYSVGSGMRIGWLDEHAAGMNRKPEFSFADLSAFSSEPLDSLNTARDPAYIMFTSGSTGNPKGVVITHSNVIHFVEWAISHFGIGGTDRLSCHSPLHFDLSVFDIFMRGRRRVSSGRAGIEYPPQQAG